MGFELKLTTTAEVPPNLRQWLFLDPLQFSTSDSV
jgi:hypothetical protein